MASPSREGYPEMTRPATALRLHLTRILIMSLGLIAATGCQTTVGNYLGNRARDFGECLFVQAGMALGLGEDLKILRVFPTRGGG